MSQWLAHVIERAAAVDDWLSPVRAEALAKLKEQSWPGRRTEAWRYTSLHAVEDLSLPTESNAQAEAPAIKGLDAIDLVFVDGRLTSDLAALNLPEGLTIRSLTDKSDIAEQVFTQVKPSHHLF